MSAQRALGPLARILLRSSYEALTVATEQFMFWNRKFKVPDAVYQELQLLYTVLPRINGQATILGKTGVTLRDLFSMVQDRYLDIHCNFQLNILFSIGLLWMMRREVPNYLSN